MIVYIDSDYRCHIENDGTMRPVEIETEVYGDKCKAYIEGFRYVPEGESWISPNGTEFSGMFAPAVSYDLLLSAQAQYEADQEQMSDMQTALEILGVTE